MALGLQTETNGGDFLDRIQYDAKAGRFFRIDRSQDAGGNWISNQTEIPLPTKLAMDIEEIEVGWMKFAGGVDFKMAVFGQPMPPDPGVVGSDGKPLYKQGFRVRVYTKDMGVRHWNHSAKCVIGNMDALHSQYLAERDQHPGEVPIVVIAKTVPVTTGSGERKSTNYAPLMTIDRWIPLPDAMKAERAGSKGNGNGHTAPAPSQENPPWENEPVPPPAAQQPAQQNALGDPDF